MKIEKNIPIPPVQSSKGEGYPFRAMEIGDSFMVPLKDKTARELQQRMARKANYVSARYTMKFTTRVVEGGVRVWRTA